MESGATKAGTLTLSVVVVARAQKETANNQREFLPQADESIYNPYPSCFSLVSRFSFILLLKVRSNIFDFTSLSS